MLRELLRALPANYAAAMFIVVHLAPEAPTVLPVILNRGSPMPVSLARSGSRVRRGTVVVAPPGLHLVLEGDRVIVAHGARENRHRPSIDVLFRSAAATYGARVTGVILSGMLDDGAAGLWAVKHRGGVAVVQHPDDAEYPDMPRNAMERVAVDYCVSAGDMAGLLVRLAGEAVSADPTGNDSNMGTEVRMALENSSDIGAMDAIGQRSPITCPECGGSLWEIGNGGPRYRCHLGHAYSFKSLAFEQSSRVEAALWAALRGLEEKERLARRMAGDARARGNERSARYNDELAAADAAHADVLRKLLAEPVVGEQDEAANA